MITIKIKKKTNTKGHLILDIPTDIKDQELDIVLVINHVETIKHRKIDWLKYVGKIQWKEDPLAFQKRLRDEW